jgi:acyl carrier protein
LAIGDKDLDKHQFLEMIEGILELEPHTLTGAERLESVEQWDSIAILDYIAAIDRKFERILSVEEISRCQTFEELFFRLTETLDQVPTASH